ncbi:hypothetical protein GGR53DRAFT_515400 [Hypoxylon sp. FL1150]|nr:hypothetical protein GGR53DRAFT_515400 [Hypoxylon sp. FL1150]
MANLPSQYPHLSLHLADRSLTPLITSSRSRPQLDALTSLTHTTLSAHESATRLGLGSPQRIMVEHAGGGPVLLQSYLRASPSTAVPSSAGTATATTATINNSNNNNNDITAAPTTLSSTTTSTSTPMIPPPAGVTTNGARSATPSSTSSPDARTPVNEAGAGAAAVERRLQQLQLGEAEVEDSHDGAPMLVGIVVAPNADEARAARRAAARLERVGREVQARWAEVMQDGGGEAGDAGD